MVVYLARQAIVDSIAISSFDPIQQGKSYAEFFPVRLHLIEVVSYVLMGLIMMALVIFIESFFSSGVPSGRLYQRFFLMSTIESGVLFAAHGFHFILAIAYGLVGWFSAIVPGVELVIFAAFFFLYTREKGRPLRPLPRRPG